MTILETQRTRILLVSAALLSAALIAAFFTHTIFNVSAARRAVAATNAHLQASIATANGQSTRTPVLVELFTSEGCSSCPPADALLAQLDHDQPVANADIIVLGEHVDYWDQLGWHDRFSSPYFTQRQKNYQTAFSLDDVYTPQVVVNGTGQFTGTDSRSIKAAIEKAAASETVPIKLTDVQIHRNQVKFTLQNGPDTPKWVDLYAALVDPSDTTEINAGENQGRILHHAGVVRSMGVMCGECVTKDMGKMTFAIQLHEPSNLNGMRLVVFAQLKHNPVRVGLVAGAASCVLSTSLTPRASAEAPFPANACPSAPPATQVSLR